MTEIDLLLFIAFVYAFFELLSSIGFFVYFKHQNCKYPGLTFIPIYKYYYLSRHSYGFCPITMSFNLPHIICPLLYVLMLVMFFIGLEPFIVSVMFFVFFSGCVYRGIFLHHQCNEIFMLTFLSACGICFVTFPYLVIAEKRKAKKQQ